MSTDKKSKMRFATLRRAVQGKFSRWKAGEVVKVTQVRGGSYLIEKVNRKAKGLPILEQCWGVPRSALKLEL